MQIKVNRKSCFIFDLDDTLMQEMDFLESAYGSIARKIFAITGDDILEEMLIRYHRKENVFLWITRTYSDRATELTVESLLQEYRAHFPELALSSGAKALLDQLSDWNIPRGLITDGRSNTQRNKLKALGIEHYFDDIIISEEFGSSKPNPLNYLYFMAKYPEADFHFFADNTAKDFDVPLKMKWKCYCLKDQGRNIHPQITEPGNPIEMISSFNEIELVPAIHAGRSSL